MSFEFFLRLIGMIVFGILGWWVGNGLAAYQGQPGSIRYVLVLALSGAALGLLIAPWLSVKPYEWLGGKIRQLPAQQLLWGTIGLAIGLIIASLLALPLSLLPSPFGKVLPLLAALLFSYLGVVTMVTREMDLFNAFRSRLSRDGENSKNGAVLLDTSVIIDGRIDDISQTGFIERTMLVPRFVLAELQHIADSADNLRRNRGRRGLEVLNRLQKNSSVSVQITDMDVEGVSEVDSKLVTLAKDLPAAIMTNDYNLNRVAELQGVRVLNINELANAVKTVVLPGELLDIEVIQEGKELGQGVGYLDDGTMVVVEDGRKYIGSTLSVVVTRVLQTVAGRMIFAQLADDKQERSRGSRRRTVGNR